MASPSGSLALQIWIRSSKSIPLKERFEHAHFFIIEKAFGQFVAALRRAMTSLINISSHYFPKPKACCFSDHNWVTLSGALGLIVKREEPCWHFDPVFFITDPLYISVYFIISNSTRNFSARVLLKYHFKLKLHSHKNSNNRNVTISAPVYVHT